MLLAFRLVLEFVGRVMTSYRAFHDMRLASSSVVWTDTVERTFAIVERDWSRGDYAGFIMCIETLIVGIVAATVCSP